MSGGSVAPNHPSPSANDGSVLTDTSESRKRSMSARSVVACSFIVSAVWARPEVARDTSLATDAIDSTLREMAVLAEACSSLRLSKKEIASLLCVSVKTVEGHTEKLMRKLDIHDRVQLSRFAIREGLVEA